MESSSSSKRHSGIRKVNTLNIQAGRPELFTSNFKPLNLLWLSRGSRLKRIKLVGRTDLSIDWTESTCNVSVIDFVGHGKIDWWGVRMYLELKVLTGSLFAEVPPANDLLSWLGLRLPAQTDLWLIQYCKEKRVMPNSYFNKHAAEIISGTFSLWTASSSHFCIMSVIYIVRI